MTNFEKVGHFMKTFGQEVKTNSELSTEKINNLRINLINDLDSIIKFVSCPFEKDETITIKKIFLDILEIYFIKIDIMSTSGVV